jgi:hypothetical protein
VVKNQAAFEAKYGTEFAIANGQYDDDSLSNGGETLKLALGTLAIHEFNFDDDLPWPTASDGDGFSVVLSHTTDNAEMNPLDPLGLGIATNWRPSDATGGSPGKSDPTESLVGPPNTDVDSDGVNALLEHFFGTSDSLPNTNPMSVSVSGGQATLTFPINPFADDVNHFVEYSNDLQEWTLLKNISARSPTSMSYTTQLEAPSKKLFFRIRTRLEIAIPR